MVWQALNTFHDAFEASKSHINWDQKDTHLIRWINEYNKLVYPYDKMTQVA